MHFVPRLTISPDFDAIKMNLRSTPPKMDRQKSEMDKKNYLDVMY